MSTEHAKVASKVGKVAAECQRVRAKPLGRHPGFEFRDLGFRFCHSNRAATFVGLHKLRIS